VEARVDAVYGEFTWKVQQGEKAQVSEFVQAPLSLARETQKHQGGGEEVNWSLSTYLEPAEVATGFNLKNTLPTPAGICPNMPNPHKKTLGQMGTWMVFALAVLLGVVMVLSIRNREKLLFKQAFALPARALKTAPAPIAPAPAAAPTTVPAVVPPTEAVFFAGPIEIKDRGRNLAVRLDSPVDNAWLGVEGALVSEQTGTVEQFEIQSSNFHGVDDGESWSEGSRRNTVYLSSVPPGTYMLRVAPAWDGPAPPVPGFNLELRSGVTRWLYIWLAFFAIVIPPLLKLFQSMSFEGRRWAESMYSGQGESSGDDSDSGGDD
jgi:hypothetical protein